MYDQHARHHSSYKPPNIPQVVTEMIRKTDSLVERLAGALGLAAGPPAQPTTAAASAAPPNLDVPTMCKVPTTESQADATATVVAAAIDALGGGAAGGAVGALVHPPQEQGGALTETQQGEAVPSALGKRGREGEQGVTVDTTKGCDGDHLRRTHLALDMWRTLTSNAKTPTSFPPAEEAQPMGSARGSNHH